jgi:hypothetical protein
MHTLCFYARPATKGIRFNVIPVGEYKHDPTGRRPKYRDAAIRFIGRHIRSASGDRCDRALREQDAPYRVHFVRDHVEKDVIYRCDHADDLVARFEEAVGGQLYFRCFVQAKVEYFELVLRYDEHRVFRYPEWSDGQKTLFAGLVVIDYHRPDVLLIDEIENHFHPEYMTQFAIFIKRVVPQTVLVTHHPHMLFSRLVDKLYYIQLESRESDEPPLRERFDKALHPRSPRRAVKELASDFDLITAAYGLFHNQDRQLLHLAEKLRSAVNFNLTKTLAALFLADVASAKRSPFVDSQTGQLLGVLKEAADVDEGAVEILDYGAGRGRTLVEVLKEPTAKRGFPFRWWLWEPDSALRNDLASLWESAGVGDSIVIIDDIDRVPPETFHVAVLSNVLHEVTPNAFAKILTGIRRVIRTKGGKLVVLELSGSPGIPVVGDTGHTGSCGH